MRIIRFGIIGGGVMGREFAGAVARWAYLLEPAARVEVVAVASRSENSFDWFRSNFPSVAQFTTDYRALLANPDVDAVYIAVPHHLHRETYRAAVEAGKHLLGEKPFGIDLAACEAIVASARSRPDVFVRCSSEFPFFPAAQRIARMIERGELGRVIEVNTGFLHSSDLDPDKPINWKRQAQFNGAYGCMGDLGLHVCHVPLRAGWRATDVRAVLTNIVTDRPEGHGNRVPCDTWDNATLLCRATAEGQADPFPWNLRIQRIAPGERNTWYLEVYGTRASARWSTRNVKVMELLRYEPTGAGGGGEQNWSAVQTPFDPPFKTITGANFEFGFGDCFLQMLAAFVHELVLGNPPTRFAGCVTPEEALLSHRLFTAALKSHHENATIPL